MKRLLAALVAGAAVFSLAFAAAAALDLNPSVIQAGSLTDVTCQEGPVTVGYHTLVDGNGDISVDGIILSGLEESCEGMTVAVSLTAGPPAAPNSGVTMVGFVGGTLPSDLSSGTFLLNAGSADYISQFPVKAEAIGSVQVLIKSGAL